MNRIDLTDVDLMEFVGMQQSQYIVSLTEFSDEIWERIDSGVEHYGDPLPWTKTHGNFRMRPGEVTLWAGCNGHGKSLVLSHVIAHLLRYCPVLLASLEMPITATGQRILRQLTGVDRPTRDYMQKALDWTNGKFWLYDQLDTVPSDEILGVTIYAMKELGCKHVVIDSLMKCGISPEDYPRQKEFVDRLCWTAKTYGGHIHLVHHIRKGQSEDDPPDKFDIKGGGEITDMVDNICIVHRNKAKERKVENGDHVDEGIPDTMLNVCKQRHGEWEGKIKLWFDKTSHQYLPYSTCPKEYFDFSQETET